MYIVVFPYCVQNKAINNFGVKIDVQKGALGTEKKMIIDVLVSSNLCCHPLLSYDNSP